MALLKPNFIDTDANTIVQELVAWYETETGKTLQPAQVERLLINAFAYREALIRNQINEAARQNLVDFSVAPVLDYLGALVGVTRLPESPANCQVDFLLVNGHGSVVIPEGTRVATSDGKYIFATQEDVQVSSTVNTVNIFCVAETPGAGANGYIIGAVNTIIDPLPFLSSVANTNETSGGGDSETDEQLRVRIKLAPEAFSSAGSEGAYKFHALSADPSIIDVAVTNPVPGVVNIYPLVEGGISTPTPIINAVAAICSGEKVRPLTDTVQVISPTPVSYSIVVNVTVLPSADNQSVTDAITAALTDYANTRKNTLGKDVMRSQIQALCLKDLEDKVYNAVVAYPSSDIIINKISFGNSTSITVNIVGINEG